jgi:hypothetical protein
MTAQLIKKFPAFYGIQGLLLCKIEVFHTSEYEYYCRQKGRLRSVISQKIVIFVYYVIHKNLAPEQLLTVYALLSKNPLIINKKW